MHECTGYGGAHLQFQHLGGQSWRITYFFSEASLVYKASSRIARAVIQRNPVSKKKKKVHELNPSFEVITVVTAGSAWAVTCVSAKHFPATCP